MDRLFRFSDRTGALHAVERDGTLFHALPAGRSVFEGYTLGEALSHAGHQPTLLAPVIPGKIVCVGLNYRDHAQEMNKPLPSAPLLFLKPSTAVLSPGAAIRLPPGVGRVDHEAELAVVIGRRAHRVPRARAWEHVFGVTCLNDVTARDIQRQDVQYTRAKGFDTFAPIGPCIAVGVGPEPRRVEGWVNGEKRQDSSSAQLIFPVDYLIEYITFVMTLEPGDIISTGTPSGVGPLGGGDVMMVKVEGVGELTNPVEAEP
jgi:2-keto-4-pentenoate hydratase/2-oxohepta-3-ene-1,7-dioic acid hydratase in catechol pathway